MYLKKKFKRLLSLILIFSFLFGTQARAFNDAEFVNPLDKAENEVRFSTELVGDISEDIEILSVTVLPHTKSGNVEYNSTDSNSTNEKIGAVVHIYLRNKTSENIYPQVTLGGKTACEYLDSYPQQISWASTPDTRASRKYDKELSNEFEHFIPATTHIPAGAVDCYSFNITDGSLIYDGVSLEITANGKSGSMTLYADYQYVSIDRIQWSSSYNDKCYPDTFEYYLNNRSSSEAKVNYIKIYDGTEAYYLHYWNESKSENITEGLISVKAKNVGFGKCKLSSPVIFREHLLEFNITNGDRTYSLIYKFKPFIYNFDISVGWAGDDIEKESYIKALSSMHFNTVIGAYGSSYYHRDEAFRKQYPIKIFGYVESAPVSDKMTVENGVITFYDIDDIHAALPFGEPQLSDSEGKHQPMRVYNKLLMYRNSPYPTNITLTHEPAFYRFAGLSDFCHYDAYRVVAPFSDAWFKYTSYAPQKKYAIYWGAPLETTGDYMRSLAAMNRPNPVAAWTQGANTWDTFPRFTKQVEYMDSPNPYELRVQAYLNVANGAASLYWFNIDGEDLLYYKETCLEMRDVNREFSVIGDYLVKQIPYWYEREDNIDLNVNIGSDCAVLFATDLNYKISDGQYKYIGTDEEKTLSFEIPDYLADYTELVKITKDGVSVCDSTCSDNEVTVNDKIDMTALYVLGYDGLYEELSSNYKAVIEHETFKIYSNDLQYDELQDEYDYSDDNPYKPENTIRNRLLYLFFMPLVRILEFIVTKSACVLSLFT